MANIPLLTADDVECRIQSVNKGKSGKVGAILLIYKNARVDMRILDEVYGADNWQRTHEVINGNLFCNIDIWDAEKKCWVRKQDVGTESNTEAEKGEASDAFKRAGFCVGIGRELYTAPFIWIELKDGEYFEDEKTRKPKAYQTLKFRVTEIGYDNKRRINQLIICDSKGNARYTLTARHPISAGLSGKPKEAPKAKPNLADMVHMCADCGKEIKVKDIEAHVNKCLNKWGTVVCGECAKKRLSEVDKKAEELAQDLKHIEELKREKVNKETA